MKRILFIAFTVVLCLCLASVCLAGDINAGELANDIEAYVTDRIVPIVVGVLTSIVALITVLKKIFNALRSLKDTKDEFVNEAKERASAFKNNTELLEGKAQEIKKTVENVPGLDAEMKELKSEMATLINECGTIAEILTLGFSSSTDVIKSGRGKQMAQLLEKSKDYSSNDVCQGKVQDSPGADALACPPMQSVKAGTVAMEGRNEIS